MPSLVRQTPDGRAVRRRENTGMASLTENGEIRRGWHPFFYLCKKTMTGSGDDPSRDDLFFINWHEADINGKVKISSLCNYLQESAWRNASDLGFGYSEAMSKDQAWVIVAQRLEMRKYPRWGETLRVETWPRDIKGLFALRDYRIFDKQDELLGAASSSWMIIDVKTRRPRKLEILRDSLHLTLGKNALGKDPELLKDSGPLEEIALHQVEYTEIDFYGHVNNTRYVDWCMNAFPMEHHRHFEVAGMTINYLLEVRDKEIITILASTSQSPASFLEGRRNTDGKSVLRLELDWRKR